MTVQFTLRRVSVPARYPNEIRAYRLKAGLTQRELGRLVGAHRSLVSTWERGHALPNLASVFRLARRLDTLAEALYRGLFDQARSTTPR